MAVITYHNSLGYGGYLQAGNFYSAGSTWVDDNNFYSENYDYNTLYAWVSVNNGQFQLEYFIDNIGASPIYELDSMYMSDRYGNSLISMSGVNILFNINDDFSAGAYFTNMLSGDDTIYGNGYSDNLNAGAGYDDLYGYAGNDTLNGAAGLDIIFGGTGNDKIIGGTGKDWLIGGGNSDSFVFNSISDSAFTAASADVISDFVRGQDKINLSALDAFTPTGGNDSFAWRGTAAFSSTTQGELRYQKFDNPGSSNDYTMVWVDNDRDAAAEMSVRLTGLFTLTISDFFL